MKQRIFNRGMGWYIVATNYKDQTDKAYCNLYFPKGTEPIALIGEQGYAVEDIDILEWKLNCYKQKIGLTVFKFDLINRQEEAIDNVEARSEYRTSEMKELPFY